MMYLHLHLLTILFISSALLGINEKHLALEAELEIACTSNLSKIPSLVKAGAILDLNNPLHLKALNDAIDLHGNVLSGLPFDIINLFIQSPTYPNYPLVLELALERSKFSLAQTLLITKIEKNLTPTQLTLLLKDLLYEMWSHAFNCSLEEVQIAQLLIQMGANSNADVNFIRKLAAFSSPQRTSLFFYALGTKAPREELIKTFIKNGAIVNKKIPGVHSIFGAGDTSVNITPLGEIFYLLFNQTPKNAPILRESHLKVATILLEAGADINETDERGNSFLMTAVQHNDLQSTLYILSHNPNLNLSNVEGKNVFDFVTPSTNPLIQKLLNNKK